MIIQQFKREDGFELGYKYTKADFDSALSKAVEWRHRKWFSSLNPMNSKEYITFGDNGQGKVLGIGTVCLFEKFFLKNIAFVEKLSFNLISVLQLLKESFEVRFKKDKSCVVDSRGDLVMTMYPGELLHMDTVGPAQFSAPYTPPQNGVIECKNHTLVEMARTMLDEHRAPHHFWAEAMNTACYLANHIFLRAYIGDDVLGESIFEDDDAPEGDGTIARDINPITSESSTDDEDGPRITTSTSIEPLPTSSEDPPEVTSGPQGSQTVQKAHPPQQIIGFKLFQMDVKSAFLNGYIEEEIYVDDIIFGGSSHALVSKFFEQMSTEFEMSLMGELKYFLGL
ncbi:hypothetical protein ABZP36_013713 [Zizania latifolia]